MASGIFMRFRRANVVGIFGLSRFCWAFLSLPSILVVSVFYVLGSGFSPLRRPSLGSCIPPPRTSASTSTHFRSPPACLCFIDNQ